MSSYEKSPSSYTQINLTSIKVFSPCIILSSFLPLGENGIITLIDTLKANKRVKIEETDLYYYIKANVDDLTIEFYSKGLVNISKKYQEPSLGKLMFEAYRLITERYSRILNSLLTKYQLSLIEVLGGFEEIPVHVTIAIEDYDESSNFFIGTYESNENYPSNSNQDILNIISNNPQIQEFIGIERSKFSRIYEDILIGTKGSIIKSEQIELLLPYHTFARSLHLFLTKFNSISEQIWSEVNQWGEILERLDREIAKKALENRSLSSRVSQLFTESTVNRDIRKIRSKVMSRINELEQIPILTEFIEDALSFTLEKYQNDRIKHSIKENSFHIRKTLNILTDRTKHSTLVAENLRARGNSILSQLDVLSAELIANLEQAIETTGILVALIGIPLAIFALIF